MLQAEEDKEKGRRQGDTERKRRERRPILARLLLWSPPLLVSLVLLRLWKQAPYPPTPAGGTLTLPLALLGRCPNESMTRLSGIRCSMRGRKD